MSLVIEEASPRPSHRRRALDARVGVRSGIDLSGFLRLVEEIHAEVAAYAGGSVPEPRAGAAYSAETGTGGPSTPGRIASSRDVLVALEGISQYYEQHEVSSPVPLLVTAAKQLVSKNFLEIARILTPDTIRQIEEIGRGGRSND